MNTQLKIEGMTCGHCASTVKAALESVPGVESAEVSLAQGRASVLGTAELAALIGAVEEEGYSAAVSGQKSPGQTEGA